MLRSTPTVGIHITIVMGYCMDRHLFFACLLAQLRMVRGSKPARAMGENGKGEPYGPATFNPTVVNTLGGITLTRLRDLHRIELEEKYIAHWDTGGIDWKYGGFIPRWDENGRRERHLKASRLCWEFMLKYCRDPVTGYWISKVTRDGKPVEGPFDIYGDMYVIMGLTEYYKSVSDKKLLEIAIETAHGINERIVSPSYQHLKAHKNGFEPGTKVLGTWQHFLGALTPLARETGDDGIGMMARMCVRNIMERHFSRKYGVFFEYLDDSFTPYRPGYYPELRMVSSWHNIQSAWMCMDEALRLNHRAMFMDALEMGRLTLEKCWREGDDGGLIGLDDPEQDVRDSSDSAVWERFDDAMVFLLLALEHVHATWAVRWYDKIFAFSAKKPVRWNRSSLLHHPRRLFFTIEILNRMIARNGRVSNFVEG